MSDNKSKKMPGILARLRMVVGLNIGTIMFGILFIYMAFSAILYFTTTHIESYQVTSGPLSRNETYTGLAIREESLCKADSSGYITYYAREGSKINASGAVYGLSDTKTASAPASLAPEELSKVRTDMMSFSKGFSSSKFNSTYSFKYELKGNILQYASLAIPHLLLLLQMRTVKEMTVVTMTKQQIFIPEIKLSASPNLMVSFYIPWIIMKEKQ